MFESLVHLAIGRISSNKFIEEPEREPGRRVSSKILAAGSLFKQSNLIYGFSLVTVSFQ